MFLVRLAITTAFVLALVPGRARADDDSIPPPRQPAPAPAPAPEPATPAPSAPQAPLAPPVAAPAAPPVPAAPTPPAGPIPSAPAAPPSAPEPPPASPAVAPAPSVPELPSPTTQPAVAPTVAPTPDATAPASVEKPASVEAPPSLERIAKQFDEEERSARRDVRRRRYEATFAYLRGSPMPSDVEEARGALVTLAFEAEAWDLVPPRADEYLAYHRSATLAAEVLYEKAYALAKLGRQGEGRAAYADLTRSVGLKAQGKSAVMRAWTSYAIWLADVGDVAGAKGVWRGFMAVFQTLPKAEAEPFLNMAADEIKYLDLIGTVPPPFPVDARDLEGRPISLADYRGRHVLIDFWATWCKPCKAELPNVLEAYRRHHERGFDVVGVVLDEPTEGALVRNCVAEHRMPWRQVHYTTMRNPIAPAYGVRGVPYTMLVGPDGKVIRVGLRGAELRARLERIFPGR